MRIFRVDVFLLVIPCFLVEKRKDTLLLVFGKQGSRNEGVENRTNRFLKGMKVLKIGYLNDINIVILCLVVSN